MCDPTALSCFVNDFRNIHSQHLNHIHGGGHSKTVYHEVANKRGTTDAAITHGIRCGNWLVQKSRNEWRGYTLPYWLASSPDLSPIENVWGLMNDEQRTPLGNWGIKKNINT
eukprot:gene22324-biopygen7923